MDITKIVEAIIGLACALITTFLVPWLNKKKENEKIKTALGIAEQVVRAAQELQITGELERIGLSKAEYAWAEAKNALESKNLTISDDELIVYIKSAVTNLRKEIEW